jgi:hypothetical protein
LRCSPFDRMEIEFDYSGAVAVQMCFQTYNAVKSVLPHSLLVERSISESLAAEYLGVNADDQHLLVVGSVKHTDPSPFRQVTRGAPEKSCCNFVALGCR